MHEHTTTKLEPVTITIDRLMKLPEVLAVFPVSASRWYAGISEGIYPKSVSLGRRSVAWRASTIAALIERTCRQADKAA